MVHGLETLQRLNSQAAPQPESEPVCLYSLDDGKTWVPAKSLTVLRRSVPLAGVNREGELLFNFTDEGLVVDLTEFGEIIGTSSQTYVEIAE